MTKLHRKTDGRLHAPAEDAFTPERGSPLSAPSHRERQMAEFAVGHHGFRYHYNGYRYDRWEDPVAHAGLMLHGPGHVDTGGPFPSGKSAAPTTDAEHALITSNGIRFADGAYRFEGFRYDGLSDAVNCAKLATSRQRDDRD